MTDRKKPTRKRACAAPKTEHTKPAMGRHKCRRDDPLVLEYIERLHEHFQGIMAHWFRFVGTVEDDCATARMAQMLHLDLTVALGMINKVALDAGVSMEAITDQTRKGISLGHEILEAHERGDHEDLKPGHVHRIKPPQKAWHSTGGDA